MTRPFVDCRFQRALTHMVSALLALAALLAPALALAQTFPALSGRVVDAASIIPDDVEARLNQKLEALESQSQRQLVVATLPSLEGYEISDYGYRLGRAWGLGDKGRNDGAILIIAPVDRKLRIEVGYGLEPILTDGLSSLIINQAIVPRFKAGDMPGGIEAGTDALITQLTLPPEEALRVAAQAGKQGVKVQQSFLPALMWMAFLFFFIILPIIRRARGGKKVSSGLGPIIVWEVLNSMSRGGGSGWSGGGGGGFSGGGGGGFSGGGGSFGGGGSSGSW